MISQRALSRCGTLVAWDDFCYHDNMDAEPLIIVYQAINKVNGKRYIGMTSRGLAWRRNGHKAQAKAGSSMIFCRAIRRYGFDAFEFSILEVCLDIETALTRERELIAQHKPEYNSAAGGLRGAQGWKHSEETRAKLRASHIGKPSYWRGKKRSPESIEKRTATRALNPVKPWLGKKRSPETIAKIIASRPFLPPPPPPTPEVLKKRLVNMHTANAKRMKRVQCVTDGQIFSSIRHAARHYGIAKSMIARCCSGKTKNPVGRRFVFIVDETDGQQQQHI
jgi:group I intron endonuclease